VRRPIPRDDLEYVRLFVTTLLAILVVPIVIARIFLAPHEAADRVLRGA
jgi:hypothetical protein